MSNLNSKKIKIQIAKFKSGLLCSGFKSKVVRRQTENGANFSTAGSANKACVAGVRPG